MGVSTIPESGTAHQAVDVMLNAPGRDAPVCCYEDFGQMPFAAAWELQRDVAAQRKEGRISDRLLFVEHPHVITLGRNAQQQNLLLPRKSLERLGIDFEETNRGGDVTYHGPGQIVAYPILDLREWKRDVGAYVRALEQVMIDAVAQFGVGAGRVEGATGAWAGEAKLGAIGVHISRWVTSHGFALNLSPDMRYFGYIVPCGLHKPVTSMERILGRAPERDAVISALVRSFGRVFGRTMEPVVNRAVRTT